MKEIPDPATEEEARDFRSQSMATEELRKATAALWDEEVAEKPFPDEEEKPPLEEEDFFPRT